MHRVSFRQVTDGFLTVVATDGGRPHGATRVTRRVVSVLAIPMMRLLIHDIQRFSKVTNAFIRFIKL